MVAPLLSGLDQAVRRTVLALADQLNSLETRSSSLEARATALETLTATTAWTGVTFTGAWVNFGATSVVEYRKVGDVVTIRGLCKSGSGDIFTLPVGFRPLSGNQVFAVDASANAHARVDVSSAGVVTYRGGGTGSTYLSLNGISFSVTA